MALALVLAANSSLAIALTDLGAALGSDQAELTWIVDAYALTFTAFLRPAGIAADRFGRRSLLVAGLVVFAVACVLSAYSGSEGWLIAWRALAGVGAAAVFPVTLAALVDAYPEERRGFAVAVWSGVSAAGAVVGTLAAGVLLQFFFWWGSIQLAFGISALLLVPFAVRIVEENRRPDLSLDIPAAIYAATGLAGFVYAVVEAPSAGWTSGPVVAAFVVASAGFAAFIWHELRTDEPALDVRLFRRRGLAVGAALVSLQFFASLALFVLAPQYLQIVRGLTPLQAAAVLLAIPVGVGAGTALSPGLLSRFGPRLPGGAGLGVMAGGFGVLAATAGNTGWLGLLAGLVLFGAGFGLAVTPGTVLILDGLPVERRSLASAINDITREAGGVLGIAVLSSLLIAASSESARTNQAEFSAGYQFALWAATGLLVVAALLVMALAPRRATGPQVQQSTNADISEAQEPVRPSSRACGAIWSGRRSLPVHQAAWILVSPRQEQIAAATPGASASMACSTGPAADLPG